MKTKSSILISIVLFMSTTAIAQSNYSKGFQEGYKKGYCYGEFGCIPPIPPITPIVKIGESADNYTDGYNRGFILGQEDKKKSTTSNSSNQHNRQRYRTSQVQPVDHIYNQPTEFMYQVLKEQDAKINQLQDQQYTIETTAANVSMQVLDEYRDPTIKAIQPILQKIDGIANLLNNGDAKGYLRQQGTLRELRQQLTREMTTGEVSRFIRNTQTFQAWQTRQLENRNIDPVSRQKIMNSRYDSSNPNGLYHILKRSVVSGGLSLPEIPFGNDVQNEWQKYADQSYNTSGSYERKVSSREDKQQTNNTSNSTKQSEKPQEYVDRDGNKFRQIDGQFICYNNDNYYRKTSLVSNALIYKTPNTRSFYNIYKGGEVKIIESYSNKINKILYNNRIYYVESKYITN